ncbi:hypothetical protein [Phenylobacterium sp.]|jgi:hypothetical protein|uniref:hypothetical protein n=1 Tax=Phenylobacterium sp. TaxID=1871053 RepID=UPI0037C814C6
MTALQPPPGFIDTPHPPVAEPGRLVSRVEEIAINRPLAEVIAQTETVALADWIDRSGALPYLTGTHMLAGDRFDAPASRHMVFLTDGTTVVEQVLETSRAGAGYRFRYVVWNYVTAAARPLLYGLGDFEYADAGEGRTYVRWTYSFELRRYRFPGFLGPLEGWLLKATFLNGPYAARMRGSLARTKAIAEGRAA